MLGLVPRPLLRGEGLIMSIPWALLKIHSLISMPKKVLCHHAEVVKNFQCFNPQIVFSAM